MLQHFPGKVEIVGGAVAHDVVQDDGLAVRGGFAQADVALDHGVEHQLAEMLAQLLKKLDPGSDEFNRALNATEEERQALYKKYNIVA